eukprot:3195273-Amphidinium_carterae.1
MTSLERGQQWPLVLHLLDNPPRSAGDVVIPCAVAFQVGMFALLGAGQDVRAKHIFLRAKGMGLLDRFSIQLRDGVPFLDLHDLSAPVAKLALLVALEELDNLQGDGWLGVVTGRGLHSKLGEAVIRPMVFEFLHSLGIYEVRSCSNPGRLWVHRCVQKARLESEGSRLSGKCFVTDALAMCATPLCAQVNWQAAEHAWATMMISCDGCFWGRGFRRAQACPQQICRPGPQGSSQCCASTEE